MARREVLFVSKAVAPPWNDSSKNLVRDVAVGLRRYTPVVMGQRGPAAQQELPGVVVEPIYPGPARFSPPVADQVRVVGRLLAGRRPALWHFFFAPNPRSSRVARACALVRRLPTIHTVCSAPAADVDPRRVLFATRTVVLSEHTEQRLLNAGVSRSRLARIAPAVDPPSPLVDGARDAARASFGLPREAPVVVYPGDLEFGGGAEITLRAFAEADLAEAWLVMACRHKTDRASAVGDRLRATSAELGIAPRVVWVGETPRIHDLLGAGDLVALPSESLYAKMDQPLVLLEAMSLERPVLVADGTPAAELARDGAAVARPGRVGPVAAEMRRLLRDGEARAELGARARQHVLRYHHPAVVARQYEALYDDVLSTRRTNR